MTTDEVEAMTIEFQANPKTTNCKRWGISSLLSLWWPVLLTRCRGKTKTKLHPFTNAPIRGDYKSITSTDGDGGGDGDTVGSSPSAVELGSSRFSQLSKMFLGPALGPNALFSSFLFLVWQTAWCFQWPCTSQKPGQTRYEFVLRKASCSSHDAFEMEDLFCIHCN